MIWDPLHANQTQGKNVNTNFLGTDQQPGKTGEFVTRAPTEQLIFWSPETVTFRGGRRGRGLFYSFFVCVCAQNWAHLGQISDVEGVVRLGGGGEHGGPHTIVDSDGSRHKGEQTLQHLGHELPVLQKTAQLNLVDVLQRARGRLR